MSMDIADRIESLSRQLEQQELQCLLQSNTSQEESVLSDEMASKIESLSRQLERAILLNELSECETLDDYQTFTAKLKVQCDNA